MLNRNDIRFLPFLKWLEFEKCYGIGDLFEVIDKPNCYENEFLEFENFKKLKDGDGEVLKGVLSDCCDAEVVRVGVGSNDEVCVNCFKACMTIEGWVKPLQSCIKGQDS